MNCNSNSNDESLKRPLPQEQVEMVNERLATLLPIVEEIAKILLEYGHKGITLQDEDLGVGVMIETLCTCPQCKVYREMILEHAKTNVAAQKKLKALKKEEIPIITDDDLDTLSKGSNPLDDKEDKN